MADLPINSSDAQPVNIADPTTQTQLANVKAASTAAVVADNSLVVALSPNSPVPTGTNKIGVTGVAQGSTTSGQNGDLVQAAVTTAAPSYTTGQTSPLSLTTVGNLRVDGSSVTQPISGTVTANQGTPNTATNKWPIEIVDSGGVNIASVNATNELLVTDTDLTLSQGSTTSGQLGPLIQGAVTTSAPTYVTAQTNPLSLTTSGDLRTVAKLEDGVGNNITSQVNGSQRALDVGIDVAGVQIDPRTQGTAAASTAGWPIVGGTIAESIAAWTSATALNSAVTVTVTGYTSILVTLNQGTTITGGVVTFEVSDTTAFTNAYAINAIQVNNSSNIATTYTLIASANQAFYVNVRGAAAFRVRLSTVISGTGTVNVGIQANTLSGDPVIGGTVTVTGGPVISSGDSQSNFSPNPASFNTGSSIDLAIDAAQNLMIRGQTLSDEGSFRDDFSGTSLTSPVTGTVTFTNGSTIVTGTGTIFTQEIEFQDYIKKTADSETLYVEVSSVQSDTQLTLLAPYAGTTGSTTAVVSSWITTTPTTGGGTITVGSSLVNLVSGTTSANLAQIAHAGDYLPYHLNVYASISQRIANQTAIIGFQDTLTGASKGAIVQFSGTTNTQVTFITQSSTAATDQQSTTVTLPGGGVTSAFHTYEIDLENDQATLTIDGILLATNSIHLPAPYNVLQIVSNITNTATAASSTTLSLDYILFSNVDKTEITNSFSGDAVPVTVTNTSSIPVTITQPTSDTFNAIITNTIFNTSETPALLIRNPSGSGKTMKIGSLTINNRTKTQSCVVLMYVGPTVTANGTVVTITDLNIGSSVTPVGLVNSGPTVTANGTLIHVFGTGANQNDLERLENGRDVLQSNHSYLITIIGSNTSTSVDLGVEWAEV